MAATLSNPKRGQPLSSAKSSWYSYYAGYSEAFVRDTLAYLKLPDGAVVADPWNGSGTTTQVATEAGHAALGFDINPVMVVVAKSRLLGGAATGSLSSLCSEILDRAGRTDGVLAGSDPLRAWLEEASAESFRALEGALRDVLMDSSASCDVWTAQGLRALSSLAAFYYVALFRTLRTALRGLFSSNPSWIRRPKTSAERLSIDAGSIADLFTAAVRDMSIAAPMCGPESVEATHRGGCRLELASSMDLPLSDSSVDAVITSPPYCTRIDYVVATQPELALLGYPCGAQLKELRDRMIGTPTIVRSDVPPRPLWGRACLCFLAAVAAHRSKASATYYHRTFTQYFSGMERSLAEVRRVLRPGGHCVLVVQDSYYKDIHNDLPTIMGEMGVQVGLRLQERLDYAVTHTLARINTRARAYRAQSPAMESVLVFANS